MTPHQRVPCPGRRPKGRSVPGRVLGLLLLVLAPAARAQLQSVRSAERSGPLQPILRVALEERYDDDVLLTGGQNAPGAFLTKIMPQAGLRLDERLTKLETFFGPDILWRNSGGQVQLDYRASFELHTQVSRT